MWKKLKVNKLLNLAGDHVDSVYNGQLSNNIIGKCDRYFNNVQVQEVKQLQDCGHYDITVVENEVLVTEWNNKGQITVYDRDLNFVHRIFINSKTLLRHMYPDNHGNLYISKTIAVFDMKGNILNTFNRVQNEVELLKQPWMVHVLSLCIYCWLGINEDSHVHQRRQVHLPQLVAMEHCTLITMVWCFTVTVTLVVLIFINSSMVYNFNRCFFLCYNATVLGFFVFFLRIEGGGGVGGVLFKPWKSFPAANNGGPMTVKESDQ